MQSISRFATRSRRPGAVTLELLLALPILLLVLVGLIELSLIYEVDKRVAYASRFAAKIASETIRDQSQATHLGNLASSGELRRQVDNYLANAGLTPSCGVILEHNACVPNPLQADTVPGCDCEPPVEALPAGEPHGAAYVRVTVCLPLRGNVMELLPNFKGFDVLDGVLRHATAFRIEDDNQSPEAAFIANGAVPPGVSVAPALPLVTPPIGLLSLTAPAITDSSLPMEFDGAITTDREEPLSALSLAWAADTTGDGVFDTTATGPAFSVRFLSPRPGESRTYRVRLDATDSCLASDRTELAIVWERKPPP